MANYGTQGKGTEHMGKTTKGISSWGESAGRSTTSRTGSGRGQERARDEKGRFISSKSSTSTSKSWGESSGRGYGSYK